MRDLSTIINTILMECALYRTSADLWQGLYDALFRLPRHICAANGMDITFRWNRVDTIDTGSDYPHLIVLCEGLVVMRGEEDNTTTSGLSMYLSRRELFRKMGGQWNPLFYGDLPYVLGFIARNDCLEIILIDHELLVARSVVKIESVRANPADAIKLFYNLAFLFKVMCSLHKRTHSLSLRPYKPRIKKTSTTELTDDGIKRTRHSLDKRQLARLADIYMNLQELHRQAQERTHLQAVRKLQLPNEERLILSVYLEPVGTIRLPNTVEEIVEWLRGMLTALKHWHERGFCHGNVDWRNAKYVPSDNSRYWILVRMDKSLRPNTTAVDWNHEFRGEKLQMQHDLYQLGQMLKTSTLQLVLLSASEEEETGLQTIGNLLLSRVADQELTAVRVVALLDEF